VSNPPCPYDRFLLTGGVRGHFFLAHKEQNNQNFIVVLLGRRRMMPQTIFSFFAPANYRTIDSASEQAAKGKIIYFPPSSPNAHTHTTKEGVKKCSGGQRKGVFRPLGQTSNAQLFLEKRNMSPSNEIHR
jgi:hypothetical protein